MTIRRIPGEMRFWVSSESRDIEHLVDLTWQEEKWHRPRFLCSCEQMSAKHMPFCKHVEFLVDTLTHENHQKTT